MSISNLTVEFVQIHCVALLFKSAILRSFPCRFPPGRLMGLSSLAIWCCASIQSRLALAVVQSYSEQQVQFLHWLAFSSLEATSAIRHNHGTIIDEKQSYLTAFACSTFRMRSTAVAWPKCAARRTGCSANSVPNI